MYKEYIELYNKYTQKYGEKTAIFLMVGSFYELYDVQNNETGKTLCNIREIIDILGIQLSTKKMEIAEYGVSECLFAGFPDYVMHKWAGRLTSNGWTVVIVDQVKDMRGKVKERKVSRILSQSTHIENVSSVETPYVMTLFLQQNACNATPVFGVAILDLTTGTTHSYGGMTSGRSDLWIMDDVVQLWNVFQPKELFIYCNKIIGVDALHFRRMFNLSSAFTVQLYKIDTIGSFTHALVRSEYFQRVYNIKSLLPVKTYLGLRSEEEELALLYLLQFVEEHYSGMLRHFNRNEPWTPHMRLICGNHALTQLQLIGTNPSETVVALFDKAITPMGKRAMVQRLVNPCADDGEIISRLNEVNDYLRWSAEKIDVMERQLRFMYDLPRLHRKVLCGIITSQEIVGLFQTYSAMYKIMTNVTIDTALLVPFDLAQWKAYHDVFSMHFLEDKARIANQDVTVFNPMQYVDIGIKEGEIQDIINKINELRLEISRIGAIGVDAIRLEEKEREPYGFKASTITIQQLKKHVAHLPEGISFVELKSGGWIDCTLLHKYNNSIAKHREVLQQLVQLHIVEACDAISSAGQLWSLMEIWISHLDATQCIGRVSRERGYICPIVQSSEHGSGVSIKSLRHPLVEKSGGRTEYVHHDVVIGMEEVRGWLVYGMNASGKSTLMKATGLCILLAQAGCFVPAKEMIIRPFKAIYTRILNHDNLCAGLSSFAVEMSELRDILRNATENTLVLGDELCSGTETTSAQALVASGIQWLSSKRSKFIFATHLHRLPELMDMKKECVEVWHLHVSYDAATHKLIYDRTLRPGNGSSFYGLEVARAMDLPMEFIERAIDFRHNIMGTTRQVDATSSKWNASIVRRDCELCKSSIKSELEVHHIEPRMSSVDGILKNGMRMNHERNLMVICGACHDKIHNGDITVGAIKSTSDGPEREVIHIPKSRHTKWSDAEITIMTDTLRKYTSLSLKALRGYMETKHGIKVSEAILSKMRKEL
jgi:DNA mismatch repair protein MutS